MRSVIMALCGPRGDLGVFVRLSPGNAQSLLAAFKDFGCDVPELNAGMFMESGRIVRMGIPPLRLEVMNEISGVSFEECYGRRVEEIIAGIRVCFIDRESLLLNQQAAGRPKDLADVAALTGEKAKQPKH